MAIRQMGPSLRQARHRRSSGLFDEITATALRLLDDFMRHAVFGRAELIGERVVQQFEE